MSVTIDANALVYASNAADPAFRPARSLLERYECKGNLAMTPQVRQRLGVGEDSVPLV